MTIYVLDSHPLMSQAIAFLLRRIDATKLVIEVHNFSKLQEAMLINGQPEAFLIDPLMNGLNGTIGIKQLKHNYPITPLILFQATKLKAVVKMQELIFILKKPVHRKPFLSSYKSS